MEKAREVVQAVAAQAGLRTSSRQRAAGARCRVREAPQHYGAADHAACTPGEALGGNSSFYAHPARYPRPVHFLAPETATSDTRS